MIKKISPLLLFFALSLTPSLQGQEKHLDVPYVPTKHPVMDEMLRLANVSRKDILYDLGCGDGRIVIAATQNYGARGVGIDIDPDRIKESQENAAKAGVSGRVQFFQQDLFQADFHEATVVSLYLLTSVNLKLRPRLLKELRPGTRIVSHNFGMGSWKPDQSSAVEVDEINHDVFLWIVPANISGSWTWTMGEPKSKWSMDLEQHFQQATGSVSVNGIPIVLKDVFITGDKVRLTMEKQDEEEIVLVVFEGQASGHSVTGKATILDGLEKYVLDWKATRDPTTEKPIDIERKNNFSSVLLFIDVHRRMNFAVRGSFLLLKLV